MMTVNCDGVTELMSQDTTNILQLRYSSHHDKMCVSCPTLIGPFLNLILMTVCIRLPYRTVLYRRECEQLKADKANLEATIQSLNNRVSPSHPLLLFYICSPVYSTILSFPVPAHLLLFTLLYYVSCSAVPQIIR